jgi:hypothetical protein
MPSAGVQKEISDAARLGERLEEIVAHKSEFRVEDRGVLLMAYWALLFDYHKGILSLLSSEICGSAFALARPVTEAVIRTHVAIMGSAEDVRSIQNDDYKVNFKKIGSEIDKFFKLEGLMEKFLKQAREALHSYTHSGLSQLGRRFHGHELRPHYVDGELFELIRSTTSAVFMATNLVLRYFHYEDEDWKTATSLYVKWGTRP